MSDQHPVRNGALAAVVGGIALSLIGRAWAPARQVAAAAWHVLIDTYAIPGWLLLILAVAVGWSVRRVVRELPSTPQSSAPVAEVDPLDELSDRVLQALAHADGEPLDFETLRCTWGETHVRVEAAVDHLRRNDLIEVIRPDFGETILLLTARGKALVVTRRMT